MIIKKTWASLEYESNPDFHMLMDNINDTYQELLVEAFRANLQQLRNLRFIECVGRDINNYLVICVYGLF